MKFKRVTVCHQTIMDPLQPHIKFLTFILLFASCEIFPIFRKVTVEGSLLELRKIVKDTHHNSALVDGIQNLENLIEEDVLNSNFNFSESSETTYLSGMNHEGSSNITEETIPPSLNETDRFRWTDLGWADLALVTLLCSIIAGTVVGNMLVIAAVATTRRLRTVTNCFVMSLAVADWLVGMFVMPPKVFLYLVDNEWRFGRIFCELWISLDILLCTASILSLCAISIDRYLAITRPLAYSRRRRSKRLALSMISCVWIAAVVITSPPIFGWYEENRNTENKCEYNENTGYVVYSALGSFFLPLLVMLYVYARIACVITRRQRSIQKLHARGDRKSQYCGSDAEEPLHQKVREDDNGGKAATGEKHRSGLQRSASLLVERKRDGELQEACHHHEIDERDSMDSLGTTTGANQESSFLGRFGLSSCTGANSEDDDDMKCATTKKKGGQHGNRQGKYPDCISGKHEDADMAAAEAIALPDPATLASGSGTENSSGSNTDHENSCEPAQQQQPHLHQQHNRSASKNNRYGNQNNRQQQQQQIIHNNQYLSRMKTGSRLCHHSIATASPQKIHRVHHQSSATSGREFGSGGEGKMSRDGSCQSLSQSARVWTVETTPSPNSLGKRKGSKTNASCKSCSYEHELAESCSPDGAMALASGDKSTSQMESVMMMECSGNAGNPASLMSAASAASGGSSNMNALNAATSTPPSSSHDKRNPYSNRIHQNRIYQPHNNTQNSHQLHPHQRIIPNNQFGQPATVGGGGNVGGIQRLRSMKFVSQIQSNDQNHNGGTSSRDFSSGRIASFKRETKTAQTLAAVVGGFIICWLPFFVAYVMGPFTPSSDTIPSALMDALIWLGWSNSAINPFIYAFYSPEFRSAFWRLTVHKCEAVLHRNQSRSSPRRYEDPPQQQRVSG